MFKNMKLGAKLIGSFIAVAALTLLLGSLAIFSMLSVKKTANALVEKNVPEVGVANEVERWSLKTMYETRGYAFTEEKQFLDRAHENLAKVKEFLKAAADHAEKHDMAELRANAKLATEKAAVYEQLLADTVKVTEALDKEKGDLNTEAAAYMKACYAFLEGQQKKLDSDLGALVAEKLTEDKVKERIKKTDLCNDVIDLGNAIRIGAWKSIANRDPELFKETMKKFAEVNAKLAELKPITHLEADLKDIADCQAAGDTYHGSMETFLANWLAREDLGAKRNVAANEVLAAAEDTAKGGMKNTSGVAGAAATSLASSSNVLIVGCIICVALGLTLGILISRSITKPILSVSATLSSGADQTAAAAGQVSASSQSLAEGASEQAASLEETSSSLEEMSSMTKRNADNAQKANDLSREARQAADAGTADMKAMAVAMTDIKTSSDDIAKIIKTIDEIAFQTNILALNAAVEAARAGEAGMGFAVVAEEVRNLAQRSAVAAKETAGKIEGAITKTALGVQLSDKVAKTLQEIVVKARQVDELISEVATASKEQTQGIAQLNTAIGQIDKVTQSNAASAEECASASEEMSAQTEALKEAVGQLLELVNGAEGASSTTATARSRIPARIAPPARSTVAGIVSPASHSQPASHARGQEKLSFASAPAKSGTNGQHHDNGEHFES